MVYGGRHYAQFLGQVGVLATATELARKGITPCLPFIDTGYDLMLEGGIRVQVKSTKLTTQRRYEQGAYWFCLQKKRTLHRNSKSEPLVYESRARQFSDDCDFVILYGETQHRFWIVPAAELDGRQTVAISDSARWIELDLDSMKAMQAQGMTLKQIANEVGVGLSTVQTRLAGKLDSKNGHGELARKMRQYENRWDLIESYLASVKQLVPLMDAAAV